jgi:hypothetical protein
VDNVSQFQRAKDLQTQVRKLLSPLDVDSLPPEVRDTVRSIQRQVADVRLDVRDYGMAETAAEQRRLAHAARERLSELEATIIKASTFNIFGAADVAMASALAQQLMSDL